MIDVVQVYVYVCPFIHLSIISLDDQPGLPQLQQFITKDGKSINLIEIIGVKCDSFGTCLLDDKLGVKLFAIKADHHSIDCITRQIFTQWLQGIFRPRYVFMS